DGKLTWCASARGEFSTGVATSVRLRTSIGLLIVAPGIRRQFRRRTGWVTERDAHLGEPFRFGHLGRVTHVQLEAGPVIDLLAAYRQPFAEQPTKRVVDAVVRTAPRVHRTATAAPCSE